MWSEEKLDSLLRYFSITPCESFDPKSVAVLLANCRVWTPRDEPSIKENRVRVRVSALESALGGLTEKVDSLEALLLQTQRDLTKLERVVEVDC